MLVQDLTLTRWADVYPTLQDNPFGQISTFLYSLGFDTSNEGMDNLINDFNWSYADSLCYFTAETDINRIFKMILLDAKKYNLAKEMYTATKTETRLRTPQLTTSTHGSANGKTTMQRKQTETQTETPNSYGMDKTHKVNPYDNPGLTEAYKDETLYKGTKTIATSFTGSPDESISTSSANSSTSETGTDTTKITTIGSDGKTLQEQIEGIEAVNTLWQMIKTDIAKKLFLQVWR